MDQSEEYLEQRRNLGRIIKSIIIGELILARRAKLNYAQRIIDEIEYPRRRDC